MSNSGRDAVRKAESQRSTGRNGAVSTKGGAVATRARGWWKKFTKKRWTHFATLVRGVGDALNAQSPGNCPIEVFISCGIDVKHRFADLLYQSLRQRGITAFLDMEVFPDRYYRCASMRGTRDKIALLEMGDLRPSTRKAIQEAFIHVPIFTNKYLVSISCLNELVEMMKRSRSDAKVIPVFYDVESQQLRKITSSTEDWVKAIHKENQHMARILGIKVGKFHDYSHEISIDRWRDAFHDASRLEELPLESYGKSEAKLLRDLEEKIVGELQARSMLEWEQGDQRSFVGLKERVRNYAYEKMYPSGREVKFVVLWGMSGIGKTTLARAIFKKVGSRFEGRRCFVENCGDKEPSQILSEVANEFLELEVSAKNLPGVEGEGERLKGEKQKFQAEIVGQIRRPPAQMLHEKGEKSRRDEKGK